jgi:hypothetical protein
MLNPPDLTGDQANFLRDLLSGAVQADDIQSLLNTAQGFLDGGIYEYMLLISVVAAEVATQRFVHKRLLTSGVSKKKLDEADKNLTYSMMLNLMLHALTHESKKPGKALIGKMNRARTLRNEYIHTGKRPEDRNEIIDLFQETKSFVNYLHEADELDPRHPPGGQGRGVCTRRGVPWVDTGGGSVARVTSTR